MLKSVFGNPVRNLVSAELLGNRQLVDHQQVMRDVCTRCNSRLSKYDVAGVQMVAPLLQVHSATGMALPFNSSMLGWLLKTHLNHFRLIRDAGTGLEYPVDRDLKHALISQRTPPTDKFRLLVEGIEGRSYLWDENDERRIPWFSYKSVRFYRQEIVVSDFRLKCVTTSLLLPSDRNYGEFAARAESVTKEMGEAFGFRPTTVNIARALKDQRLEFPTIQSFESLQRSIIQKKFDGPPRNSDRRK